ncbi:MAG TPA: heavy-metal-associated domain-containing protein [Vicinamibacterales bacterium]|nr:heavy-metal-associated domain-containing protein [Vicinamibacterales bacterium]
MKSINVMPGILGAIAIVGAAEAGTQDKARPVESRTVTLKVDGMACSACSTTVEKSAKRMRGVIDIKASQPKGTAEVTYDGALTTADEVAKFIAKNTGFKTTAPK